MFNFNDKRDQKYIIEKEFRQMKKQCIQKSTQVDKGIIQRIIQINLTNNLKDLFISFFNRRDLMDVIVNNRGGRISKDSNLIVLFENNLILFSIVDLFSDKELSTQLTESYEELKRVEQDILDERIIHLKFANRYYYEAPVNEIKIIKIILYESIDLSPKPILFSFETNSKMTVISIMDLISIFELTSSPLKFIKFLEEKYNIFLIPKKICNGKPFLSQFEKDYDKVNEENPIVVKSFVNTHSILISNVFYNHEFWGEKFADSKNNENALYAIRQLIYSLIRHFEPFLLEEETYNKIDDFLKTHFISTERDYYLDTIPTRNSSIKKYTSYLKLNPTDQERVIKEVESYLREKNFIQRHLSPEESKDLFNEIYKTFYEKL